MLFVFARGVLGADKWLLMAGHGECVEIAKLGTRIPELAEAPDERRK